jgi:hypothetical protein
MGQYSGARIHRHVCYYCAPPRMAVLSDSAI